MTDGTPTAGEGGKYELPVCFWNYILGLYSQQIEMQCRLVLKLAKVDDISQSTLVLKEF